MPDSSEPSSGDVSEESSFETRAEDAKNIVVGHLVLDAGSQAATTTTTTISKDITKAAATTTTTTTRTDASQLDGARDESQNTRGETL